MADPVSRLQIMAVDNPVDPNNLNVHQKGDLICLVPGSLIPGSKETLPNRIWINITNGNYATHRAFWESWQSRLDYTAISLSTPLDQWRVTVFMTNIDSSNRGGLTKAKVDNELGDWNISSGTTQYAPNQVRFTAKIYDVARSSAILNNVNQSALDQISWSEDSYNAETGEHVIRGDYSGTGFNELQINKATGSVNVISHDTTAKVVTYSILRSEIFSRFKLMGEDKLNQFLGKSRYKISTADVDAIVGTGGTVSQTQAQVQAALIDKIAQ